MSRHRRGLLLAGLALVLGGLAASDVAGREAALERRLGPLVDVVVARDAVRPGERLTAERLGLRRVPARYAPRGAFGAVGAVNGLRAAAPIMAGEDIHDSAVDDGRGAAGAPVRAGERVVDVVAVGSAQAVTPGSRVDVLVTREARDGGAGRTTLALEDVEVLAARPAGAPAGDESAAPRVAAALRVTLRQAVYLAAAQTFAREIRLLPRAAGDGARGDGGLTITDGL